MFLGNFKNKVNRVFYFFLSPPRSPFGHLGGVFRLLSKRRLSGLTSSLLLLFFISQKTMAASAYVLPYPSFMLGHKLYRVEQVLDTWRRFWAFGNFSRHKYELGMADKKLVEAKILFEYGQYLLATQALADSSQHWQKAADYLKRAENERKDISQKLANFQAAAEKHREVLESLKEELPEEYDWQPEKEAATKLDIKTAIQAAIKNREI